MSCRNPTAPTPMYETLQRSNAQLSSQLGCRHPGCSREDAGTQLHTRLAGDQDEVQDPLPNRPGYLAVGLDVAGRKGSTPCDCGEAVNQGRLMSLRDELEALAIVHVKEGI